LLGDENEREQSERNNFDADNDEEDEEDEDIAENRNNLNFDGCVSKCKKLTNSLRLLLIYRDDEQDDINDDNQNEDDDVDPLDLGAAHQQQVQQVKIILLFCRCSYFN